MKGQMTLPGLDGAQNDAAAPVATEHTGPAVVRHTPYGITLVLCPAGHFYRSISTVNWSGSELQAEYVTRGRPVVCGGAFAGPAKGES